MSDTPPVEWFASGRIDPEKLENYLLSPTHTVGRHKARLWKSVFDLELADRGVLERLIREQLGQGTPGDNQYGPNPKGATARVV